MRIDLDVDGLALDPSALRGRLAIGEPFRFDVDAFTRGPPPEARALLGRPFVLAIVDAFDQRLVVRGIVMAVDRTISTLSGGRFALTLGPAVLALSVGEDRRGYADRSAVEIVREVLDRGGLGGASRWSITAPPPKRPWCVQHGESDLAFIDRLLAEEGIASWFDLDEAATTLVLGDDTTAAEDLPGGATLPFQDDSAIGATRDAVLRVERRRLLRSDAVALRDHDVTRPALVVEGRASRGSSGLEVYDWPARASSPDLAAARASRRLEAISADRDVISGETSGVRLVPGYALQIDGHPVASLDARLLVRQVTYHLELPRHGEARVEVRWDAIPIATPWRPPFRQPRSAGGPQSGVVVGPAGAEIHPDDRGRVRAQLRWDRIGRRDAAASTWQRVGQLAMSGSMTLPRVGWDVLVAYDADDLDAPFVLTHLHDGEHPPPYPLPANATRSAWGTRTTPGDGSKNEIRFEDGSGREELSLVASGDHDLVVANALEETIGNDEALAVGASSTVTAGGPVKLVVGGSQSVRVGGSESLSVAAGRTVEVAGAEAVAVGGARSQTAIAGSTLDAQGGRSLCVGGSLVAASAMEIGRSALGSATVTVGGAHVVPAASGVSAVTVGACAETVGGAKIEVAGSSHATTGKGALAITVGAAQILTAGGNVGESSTSSLTVTVGGAFVGTAAEVSIEGETEITVRAGAATIVVRPGSVEVRAPAIGLPAGSIDTGGATVEHN